MSGVRNGFIRKGCIDTVLNDFCSLMIVELKIQGTRKKLSRAVTGLDCGSEILSVGSE